ncbi:type I-F CRISPR-associated protein Csy2 [Pseudomonas syringae]|nr:type I-F CRISPR-associated protein Csy2 [Pseudomonas syringae]
MSECPHFDFLLVIPRIRVQNANSISSSLTHGFPSITAFLGLMWALERKTQAAELDLQFNAVGVVAHAHDEHVTEGGFVHTLRLTRNPIGRDGSTAAIVEEGRMHMDISLVFAVQSKALQGDLDQAETLAKKIRDLLFQMRIAGGSVITSRAPLSRQQPYLVQFPHPEDGAGRRNLFRKLRLRLLPGFTLVERQDLLEQRHCELTQQNPQASRLESWLSLSRVNWHSTASEAPNKKLTWSHDRKGWIVPIPLGYGALADLQPAGTVVNARDSETPFRFVESLYGIGEWLSPHRLHSAEQLLWYADSQPENGLYRCRNDYHPDALTTVE